MQRTIFTLALLFWISSVSTQGWAQQDSLKKYQNNYRYVIQLELKKDNAITLERIWGKLRKPRFGIVAGSGYTQDPGLLSTKFDFSRGVKTIRFTAGPFLLIPVSPNSDVETVLTGDYNLRRFKGGAFPDEKIVRLKAGYRWHTPNRKWTFRIGGQLSLGDNFDSKYETATHGQNFRFIIREKLPYTAVGRTF